MPERVVLGRIAGSHALRGEVRVQYFGDGPDNLLGASEVWLGESREDTQPRRYEVLGSGTGRSGEVRLALSGVSDRDASDALRGRMVLADPEQLLPLEEGEFYWHQLVGCQVFDTAGSRVGTVREIWETGAHDVLVVDSEKGGRQLFSTARELMPEVDLEARRIVVEILPGMLDSDGER